MHSPAIDASRYVAGQPALLARNDSGRSRYEKGVGPPYPDVLVVAEGAIATSAGRVAPCPVECSRSTMRRVDTDTELLARLRDGDEGAFVTLVTRYQQPMLRLARTYVPSRAVAEEAVQDTWMGVVKGIERFEGRAAFKTWLFRILINRARSAGTQEQRHATTEPHRAVDPIRFDANGQWADPVERWTEDSEDRLEAATWAPTLQVGLEDLPPRQRQVVVLRDMEGLSSDEVCDLLEISPGNQRLLLHRGRARLRETLDAHIAKA